MGPVEMAVIKQNIISHDAVITMEYYSMQSNARFKSIHTMVSVLFNKIIEQI